MLAGKKRSSARHLFYCTLDLVDEDVFVGGLQWRHVEVWVRPLLALEVILKLYVA